MKIKSILLSVIISLVSTASCIAQRTNSTSPAQHVILIGLDGWGAYSMPQADMPNVKNLMESGAYSLHKRSVLPSSSAPNWAAMFMGVPTEVHGYTKWGSKTPEIPSPAVNEHGIFPTIFSIARQGNPEAEIGVLYEWNGIKHLVDTLALSYHAQGKNPDTLCEMTVDYIREHRPMLMAVCFDEPDHTGHKIGHDTPEYYAMLTRLDGFVGDIVDAVNEAGIADSTVIIVTGDHGGINKDHGGITLREMETSLVMSGPGVAKHIEYNGILLQQDVSPTIAALLGIETPVEWIGRPCTGMLE